MSRCSWSTTSGTSYITGTDGMASYYASGWHTIGSTDGTGQVHVQMLPGSYSFAMTYLGTREQQNHQTVTGASSIVTFQTGQVSANFTGKTVTSYYASGWKPFTNGMQMLPGHYTFGFSSGPNAIETIHAGQVNTIP